MPKPASIRLGTAGDALGEQALDGARLVERPARANADALHRAIDAEQAQLQAARALHLPLEQHDEIVGEPASVAITPSTRAIGLAKRRSATKSGGGKRGEIEGRAGRRARRAGR